MATRPADEARSERTEHMVADMATRLAVRREETIGDALAERKDLTRRHDPWEWSQLTDGKRRTLALWAGEADADKKQGLLEITAIFQALMDADGQENRLHRQDERLWDVIAEKANSNALSEG